MGRGVGKISLAQQQHVWLTVESVAEAKNANPDESCHAVNFAASVFSEVFCFVVVLTGINGKQSCGCAVK